MKKGITLVETIAVIIIIGIIASVTAITITTIINRQRKNATINSLNNILSSARALLLQVKTDDYDSNITIVDEDFCYISLTTLIDSGNVDGSSYKPTGDEIYFCYDMSECYCVITSGEISKGKPTETSSTTINKVLITYSYNDKKFILA